MCQVSSLCFAFFHNGFPPETCANLVVLCFSQYVFLFPPGGIILLESCQLRILRMNLHTLTRWDFDEMQCPVLTERDT